MRTERPKVHRERGDENHLEIMSSAANLPIGERHGKLGSFPADGREDGSERERKCSRRRETRPGAQGAWAVVLSPPLGPNPLSSTVEQPAGWSALRHKCILQNE